MARAKEDWSQDTPTRPDHVLNLKTVQKMLPLVRHIVGEILARHADLVRLQPQEDRLQRQRRTLDWSSRKRRYLIQDEISQQDLGLHDALQELGELGVVMLDLEEGRVGFPTLVNNRPAFFTWKAGEDSPHSWQFAEEDIARPIPEAWLQEISFSSK